MAVKRLGTLLVEEQLVTEEQLAEALQAQKASGEPLGEVLVRLGFITEEPLFRFLAIQHGLEYVPLDGVAEIPQNLLGFISPLSAWKYQAIPIRQDDGVVTMTTSQPDELSLFYLPQELKLPESTKLKITVSSASQVTDLLNRYFPKSAGKVGGQIRSAETPPQAAETAPDQAQINLLEGVEQEMLNPDEIGLEILEEDQDKEEDEGEVKDDAPVIKMCTYIIANAVRSRASDVHITPYEKKMTLRYRIDGALVDFPAPPVNAKRRISTRYKIMAGLNIMERRKPLDGRIHIKLGGNRPVDIRLSTMPTRWGENIVMRIVDQTAVVLDLEKLGFEHDQLDHFKRAISQPYGMVFVTGPTASGKTTTLFCALSYINTPAKNIATVEDPVEFRLPHVVQIQVDPVAGRTFASVLRAFLRHDPNIMMVGEIRDNETADIAIKASLTGHLVLSSLHTNDAVSSIMRLVDLGIDPVYVGSSVLCVASQRLVRKVCEKCKVEAVPSDEQLARVKVTREEIAGLKLFEGKGCSECLNSGYRGRLAVYEVLPITTSLREVIFARGTLNQLKASARESGFKNLREVALLKWKQGLTTLDEVVGETYE